MKKTIIFAAALVAMTACNKTIIETPMAEYGTISLGVSTDTEMVVTKAGEDLSGYNVTLKQGDDEKWTKEYSAIQDSDLKVPAGTYTLYVENLTEAEAAPVSEKGAVRVAGQEDVTVKAGIDNPVMVTCTAINSRVTVAHDFGETFSDPVITITDGSRALGMAWGHEIENGAYYSAGKSISWNLTVTLGDGTTKKTYSKANATTTVEKKWTQINFSPSNTDGNIKVTIVVDGTISETVEVSETINPLEGTPVENN